MMLMHRLMKDASPEKKRVMFALYGGLLTIGLALLLAYVI